ncbi:NAD-dependent epimerase/dehydratase family protein [Pseudactinotalea terrae]|uniref:NAD-dependent epimerase/dehydratase family protein n=1 Tax=Pseudactinotalea terrae TaxID=1743262 RepID=UPI0012E1432C|nr:NAD(P)-dependent oxidoreductase [Pseudactinotalea terrae]
MSVLTLTGASGRLAGPLRPALRAHADQVRLFDRVPVGDPRPGEVVIEGELEDLDAVEAAVSGAEVIVHLGGKADEAPFPEILSANVVGTYHVLEAAHRHGVRRVVYASSHHVTGFYQPDQLVGIDSTVRPDSYYGVSKVVGESLGRLYHDKWGLEVVCLRIGVCREAPETSDQLRTWLSPADSVQLVMAAVTAPLEHGYQVVYGFSDNSRAFWSRDGAAAIGFEPGDSADDHAEAFDVDAEFSHPHQGGAFAAPDYRGGIW